MKELVDQILEALPHGSLQWVNDDRCTLWEQPGPIGDGIGDLNLLEPVVIIDGPYPPNERGSSRFEMRVFSRWGIGWISVKHLCDVDIEGTRA